jgi:hypothetical protein
MGTGKMSDNLPIFTTSERRAFKRCQQRWWWEYRAGLRRRDGVTPTALWFGIGIHEALASLYQPGFKRNKDFIDVWTNYCDSDELSISVKADVNGEEIWADARELGVQMLQNYINIYDWDKNWDVIAIETPFQLEIPHPADPEKTLGVFTSTYDGVYRDKNDGKIKLMEHKTAKAIITSHLPMDDQGGSYWMSANFILRDRGVLGPKESIQSITYNFLRKAMQTDKQTDSLGRILNKDGSISKRQPPPLLQRVEVDRTIKEQKKQIERMSQELLAMEQYREKKLLPIKTPGNDTCPMCPYKEMCELEERGAAWQEFRDAVYIRKDPYDRYRKSA